MARIPGVEIATTQRDVYQPATLTAQQAAEFGGGGAEALGQAFSAGAEIVDEVAERKAVTESNRLFSDYALTEQESIREAQIKYQTNPEGYTDDVLEGSRSRLDNILEGVKSNRTKNKINDMYKKYRSSLALDANSWQADQSAKVQMDNMNVSFENLQTQAMVNPSMYSNSRDEMDRMIEEYMNIGMLPNPESFRQNQVSKMATNTTNALISQGRLLDATAFVKENKSDLGDNYLKAMELISREQQKIKNKENAQKKVELREQVQVFDDMYDLGILPDAEAIQSIKDKAADLEMPSLAENIDMKVNTANVVSDFVQGKSLAEQSQDLSERMKSLSSNPTKENLFELKSLQNAMKKKIDAIQSGDGMLYYQEVGLIQPQSPLDPTDIDNVSSQYANRVNAAQVIRDKEGISVPLFTKDESKSMVSYYNSLPVKDKRNYILNLTSMLGQEHSQNLASVVAQDQTALAGIMAIASENPQGAEMAIRGAELDVNLSKSDVDDFVLQNYGTTLKDPAAINSVSELIHSAAKQKMIEENTTVLTTDMFEEISENLIGPKIEYGNTDVIGFRKENNQFISEGEFKRLSSNLTTQILLEKQQSVPHINGNPVDDELLQDVIGSWGFVTVGDGLYEIRNGEDVLLDKSGAPYVFDLKGLSRDADMSGILTKGWNYISQGLLDLTSPLPGED